MKAWTREWRGALAALLYVVLALLLPGWHLPAHRLDHDHGSGGIRYSLHRLRATRWKLTNSAERPHPHGAHTHHGQADQQYDRMPGVELRYLHSAALVQDARSEGAREDEGPPHGIGSLLHFAAAFLAADGPPIVQTTSLLAVRLLRPALSSSCCSRSSFCPLGARAPPCLSPS